VGHKLPGPSTNINQVRPELMGAGNAQIRRPFPQFGNVTINTPFWGNSSYHGLNTKLEKRFSGGLNFLVNSTFAKFIDDVTSGQEIGQVGGGIQNVYNRRAEKSLSGNDVRHRFVASSVYELPWGKGRRWLASGPAATILGGWGLGVILTLQAGSPDGLVTQVNNTNAFGGSQRVNVLRDPTLPKSERRIDRYFDTTAVVAPPQFTFGNAGRALFSSPGLANADLSLLKNHQVGERFNLQFRIEAFNAFNRVNLEDPGRALGAANFGVIGDSRPARNLQLGMKLTF
ncbi:MAG: carboxypeptidase regulatory-like domain-containing protein, partial [Gammaproteobacteria bacterium]